jgi:hypothetical protein
MHSQNSSTMPSSTTNSDDEEAAAAPTIEAQIESARLVNVNILRGSPDKATYLAEVKRYQKWLSDHGRGADEEGRWITRQNLELYFSTCLAQERSGVQSTLARIGNGLQWYADFREYPGESFVVKDGLYKTSLRAAVVRSKQTSVAMSQAAYDFTEDGTEEANATTTPRKKVGDPHLGLKDVIPEEDRITIMKYIYGNRDEDWQDICVAHTWGNNAAARGASSRSFVACDLNLSRGFGPERTGPLGRAILLVLRKGDVHKERRDTDQQICTWRHRDYRLCSVFALSISLIHKVSRDNSINFYHADKYKRAKWWNIPVIDFNKCGEQASCMKQVYRATGVVASKVTHDRTHAIQYGGSESLQPYQIHSVSKHMTEKFYRSYQSEADKEVSSGLYKCRTCETNFHSLGLGFCHAYLRHVKSLQASPRMKLISLDELFLLYPTLQ